MKRIIVFLTFSLLLIISYTAPLKVVAATGDDLRELVGKKRLTDEAILEEIAKIDYEKEQTELHNFLARNLLTFRRDLKEKKECLEEELLERQNALRDLFSGGAGVNECMKSLNEVRQKEKEIESIGRIGTKQISIKDTVDVDARLADCYPLIRAIGDEFDIGDIGTGIYPPYMSSVIEITEPYGSHRNADKDLELDGTFLTIRAAANTVDRETTASPGAIYSQFNGVVTKIDTQWDGVSDITVTSGKSVIVIYYTVGECLVSEGQAVSQGEMIGIAPEKLRYRVLLNEKPINPLYLYGKLGKTAYERYLSANPGAVTDAESFAGVLEKIPEKEEEKIVHSTFTDQDGNVTVITIEE